MISSSQSDQQDERNQSRDPSDDECIGFRRHTSIMLVRSPVAMHSCFRDGVSIVNLSTGAYFRLEAIGFRIWKILTRPATIEEITADMIEDCAMEPEVAETTIVAFVDNLKQAGLVNAP